MESDEDFPDRDAVLSVINDTTLTHSQKEFGLRSLKRSFRYMINNYVDEMRTASATFVLVFPFEEIAPVVPIKDTLVSPASPLAERTPAPKDAAPLETKRTFMALKTNLLYDATTTVNFAVEIPINENFSFQYEHICPWWLSKDNRKCLQILSFGGEFRWWFAPRPRVSEERYAKRDAMVGHFLGAYGFGGKTDIQWDRKIGNYQAEFFSAGLTYGFVLPVSKYLNMEFSISAGYARIPYRHYIPTEDWQILVRDPQKTGVFHYFGPTKAEISLVIPFRHNAKLTSKRAERDERLADKEMRWKAAKKNRRTAK